MAGLASADLVTVEWDISSESYNGESVSLYGLQQEPAWADALLVSWDMRMSRQTSIGTRVPASPTGLLK